MASFNRVILLGNLTRDPELRYIPSGTAVTDIGLAINDRRKELNCEFTDRIAVGLVTDSEELRAAVGQFREYIQTETLAVTVGSSRSPVPIRPR